MTDWYAMGASQVSKADSENEDRNAPTLWRDSSRKAEFQKQIQKLKIDIIKEVNKNLSGQRTSTCQFYLVSKL